jgi:hypothetical protein
MRTTRGSRRGCSAGYLTSGQLTHGNPVNKLLTSTQVSAWQMAGYAIKELQDDFLNAIRSSREMTIQAVRTFYHSMLR